MRAAKGKKRLVIVAAAMLLLVLLALPAGASLPRSAGVADLVDEAAVAHIAPAPTIAPASILPETSAATPRAGPARARLRVHLASPPSWPFSPARVGAFGRAEPKTRVWGFDFGLSGQRQANQWFNPRIAEGVHNGPSMYQFAGYSPANYSDPLGLDAFIVRYGEAESDVDTYVTIRYMKRSRDRQMTNELFWRGIFDFEAAARQAWAGLSPQIVSPAPGMMRQRANYMIANSAEPYVTDIVLDSSEGRSSSKHFFLPSAEQWTFAHEFGHHLGIRDLYTLVIESDGMGGERPKFGPNVSEFGQRAVGTIMGDRDIASPSQLDLHDIRTPGRSNAEDSPHLAPVHHLDISGDGVSEAVAFLRSVSRERGIDAEVPLALLATKTNIQQRRFVMKWLMNSLFGPGSR